MSAILEEKMSPVCVRIIELLLSQPGEDCLKERRDRRFGRLVTYRSGSPRNGLIFSITDSVIADENTQQRLL